MSNELIRKSEVIKAIKKVLGGYCMGSAVVSVINEIQPVNAVELPCKVGDEVFCIRRNDSGIFDIESCFIVAVTIYEDVIVFTDDSDRTFEYFDFFRGRVFFTREEAEKALEDLENE